MTRPATAALAALLLTMPALGLAKDRAPRGAAAITADELRDYLTFLAADEMEGRDTPSRGLAIAGNFIAANLARWGLKPIGDGGTFFQQIALTRRTIDADKSKVTLGARTYQFGDDFLAASTPGTADGPLLYVGHGVKMKAKNLDPYQGLDVAGKILIAQAALPPGVTRNDMRGPSGDETWESAITYGRRHGALAVIQIPDFMRLANWNTTRRQQQTEGQTTVDKLAAKPGEPERTIPVITASPALVRALFADEASSGETIFKWAQGQEGSAPFALKKRLHIEIGVSSQALSTRNVVAVLEGSDPKLKQEYIAVGAHYDHVGTGTGAGDIIYNGADDDGSGTTAVLAMAEAFAKLTPRPKRSLLFVWHAGEEQGLWGSDYVTQFPPVPIEQIVTQLNIDMIGRSRAAGDEKPANKNLTGPEEIYVIGSKMMSTELGELSEKVNKDYLNLSFNYKYDDPKDPNRFFFRSDHYNYARKGVPIIFYFSGVHEDYHKVTDSVEKIDFAKMEKVTRTVYATALALADAPSKMRVDKKLPKELTEN